MHPQSNPSSTIPIDFNGDPSPMKHAMSRPSTISEKYSGDRKLNANSASGGPINVIATVPTQPANSELSAATANAGPARPSFAIAWPSRQVTTEPASPGTLIRIAVVDPPYCVP